MSNRRIRRAESLTESSEQALLVQRSKKIAIFMEAVVPLHIATLRRRGGPTAQEHERIKAFGFDFGSYADRLFTTEPPRPATREAERAPGTDEVLSELAFALAVASFQPGGVKFWGLHFETAPCSAEEAADSEQRYKQHILDLARADFAARAASGESPDALPPAPEEGHGQRTGGPGH